MKRGPFYMVTSHDVRKIVEACESINRLRSNGREEDEVTIKILKWNWVDGSEWDFVIVEANEDWETYWKDAIELGEYHLHYHFKPEQFFEYVVEQGWLD